VIDHSDAVGFPVAGTEHYDHPHNRRAANGYYTCQHRRPVPDCSRCEAARSKADLAYLMAVAATEPGEP